MKGLILTHLGKREEGLELVRKGIRFDLTSHIVWHVFGLIQKGEKNYEEALKSYTQALRFDRVRSFSACITGNFTFPLYIHRSRIYQRCLVWPTSLLLGFSGPTIPSMSNLGSTLTFGWATCPRRKALDRCSSPWYLERDDGIPTCTEIAWA